MSIGELAALETEVRELERQIKAIGPPDPVRRW
jgi:hypothetical protein